MGTDHHRNHSTWVLPCILYSRDTHTDCLQNPDESQRFAILSPCSCKVFSSGPGFRYCRVIRRDLLEHLQYHPYSQGSASVSTCFLGSSQTHRKWHFSR